MPVSPSPPSTPRATPPATATPARSSPLPDATVDAGLRVDEGDIARHLDALAAIADLHGGTRASGTPGYDASADYVADQLQALGYQVERQRFGFTYFEESAPVSLTVGDASWSGTEWLHAMIYSGEGSISGALETVGMSSAGVPTTTAGCNSRDWARFPAGRIALVTGGPCLRRDVVLLAQAAGARALVTIYPTWNAGETKQPTLFDPEAIDIPAVAAGREPAVALLAAAADGTPVQLSVDVSVSPSTTENVIGQLAGEDDAAIMLGGHLDSVLDGPGINDNGSGVATLLAIAEALAARTQPQRTVRFAFWAAEELGIVGSTHYVDSLSPDEIEDIVAYINLDMVGSPNAGRYVYEDDSGVSASAEMTATLLAAFSALGAPATTIPSSGGSDHLSFQLAGIPIGGLYSGAAPLSVEEAELFGGLPGVPADACYHLRCDDRGNVNSATAALFGNAVAALLRAVAY